MSGSPASGKNRPSAGVTRLPASRRRARGAASAAAAVALLAACEVESHADATADAAAERDTWLVGGAAERTERIERQFGGFSQSMWEVGYRYTELYWALRDQNPELAGYHAEKIGDAIERGLERRPARALSARELFLGPNNALEQFRAALETGDDAAIDVTFRLLTDACNACHENEEVGFIRVAAPERRLAPLAPPGAPIQREPPTPASGGGMP